MTTPANPLATQAPPPKFDLTTAVKDPDFLKAPPHEKVAFLAAHDADFAQAHPADQGAYLAHLLGTDEKTQFEKDRPGEGITSKGSGGAAWDAVKSMVGNLWEGAKKSFSTGDEYASPAEYVAKQDATNAERQAQDEARKKAGYSPFYRAAAQAGAPVDPASMERHAARGEGGAILGEAGAGIAATVAPSIAKRIAKPISAKVGEARESLSRAVRDPATGKVKSPYELAVDKMLPDPNKPTSIPARPIAKGTNYGQYLEDQKAAAAEAKVTEKAAAEADAEARKPVPLNQSPYYKQNVATAEAEADARKPVPLTQSPYYEQNQAKLAEQAATEKAATAADVEARKPVPVTQSPYYAANKAALDDAARTEAESRKPVPVTESPYWQQNRAKAAATAKAARTAPVIATPSGEGGGPRFTGHEGRPATWTNERVMQLARAGNREAIQQAVRRGMELPPNARYVAGDADFSSGTYNPRDVTTFGPDGTPIRQGGKVSPIAKPFSSSVRPSEPPEVVYRAHDAGKYEIDLDKHAHATESEAEAQSYAEHRNEGTPQKVSRIPMKNLKPDEYIEHMGPNGKKWYTFKRQLGPGDYEQ